MAKPKQETLVEEYQDSISVWTNEPLKEVEAISNIEGVNTALIAGGINPIYVYVDPRYSVAEIAKEIRALLTANVPDVFEEGLGE
jgi:hypothetical protein